MTPGATPTSNFGATPAPHLAALRVPSTPLEIKQERLKTEFDRRNRALTDEELDAMLPPTGYEVVPPPTGYEAIRTPARKLTETPTPMHASGEGDGAGGYAMPKEMARDAYGVDLRADENMPALKPEDMQAFGALLTDVDESTLRYAFVYFHPIRVP